jgi:hypothetical protein
MPISISGSGTITGISTGGLPDGCISTDDLANNAVTTAKLGSGEASGLCKAWVNFNGTGTVAIRASYNVSSITDNGVGDYTVNFTSAMPDANYSYAFGGSNNGSVDGSLIRVPNSAPRVSASQFRILVTNGATTSTDTDYVAISIFR